MSKLTKLFFTIILFILCFVSFNLPAGAKAYSPIIASCSNGVLEPGIVISTASHDTKQLFEVRLDDYYLDAVAVRVDALNENSNATISVIKRDGPTLASANVDVSTTESWVYVDLNNVVLPRGVYYLKVTSTNPNVVFWKYTVGTCINDSHLLYNDAVRLDIDMAFAIYAYKNIPGQNITPLENTLVDPSTGDQDQNPTTVGTDLPGSQDANSTASTENTTNSSSKSSAFPSKEDILKMTYGDNVPTGGILGDLFTLPIGGVLFLMIPLVLFLVFIGVIILIIVLVRRKNKTKTKSD